MTLHLFTVLKQAAVKLKELDRKVVIVFISVALLQTVSWYYSSRSFFRLHLFDYFSYSPDVYLFEYIYWFASDTLVLFVIPLIIIKLLFKEKISSYGLKPGDYKTGLQFSFLFIIVMLIIIWIVSSGTRFSEIYPMLPEVRHSWINFVIFESGLLIYMFAWEFIWRGYMLFGLEEKFSYYSVFIQMLPFLILHNGKPAAETFGAIAAGLILGILALRTRSIYYGFITHAAVMFSIDLISTLRYRADDYGLGLSSFINLLKEIFRG